MPGGWIYRYMWPVTGSPQIVSMVFVPEPTNIITQILEPKP